MLLRILIIDLQKELSESHCCRIHHFCQWNLLTIFPLPPKISYRMDIKLNTEWVHESWYFECQRCALDLLSLTYVADWISKHNLLLPDHSILSHVFMTALMSFNPSCSIPGGTGESFLLRKSLEWLTTLMNHALPESHAGYCIPLRLWLIFLTNLKRLLVCVNSRLSLLKIAILFFLEKHHWCLRKSYDCH